MRKILIMALLILLAVPAAALAESVNPVGEYDFKLWNSKVTGDWPMGRDGSGKLSILKRPGGYVLTYIRGMTCSPPQVCTLAGKCRGRECSFSTNVQVDEEGGRVTNSVKLLFHAKGADGEGSSVYRHPSGVQCTWTYKVTLTK